MIGFAMSEQEKRSAIMRITNCPGTFIYTENEYLDIINEFILLCSKSAGVKFSLQAVKESVDVPNVNILLIRELLANRRNKHTQLPDDVVIGIKRMYASGMSKYTIAKELGISRNTVNGYLK